jgi:hypothetical protein
MHSSAEVQGILGLFDGEISIYEKESKENVQSEISRDRTVSQERQNIRVDLANQKRRLL